MVGKTCVLPVNIVLATVSWLTVVENKVAPSIYRTVLSFSNLGLFVFGVSTCVSLAPSPSLWLCVKKKKNGCKNFVLPKCPLDPLSRWGKKQAKNVIFSPKTTKIWGEIVLEYTTPKVLISHFDQKLQHFFKPILGKIDFFFT